MNLLFLYGENFTNGFRIEVLDFIYITAVLCGMLVITSKNPIVSVLFLIGLFFSISCYLIMLGINFIGLSYLLVYVGAVSILFLFILMLINVRVSELLSDTNKSIPLAILIGILFNFPLYRILPISDNLFKLNFTTTFSNIIDNDFFNFFYSSLKHTMLNEDILYVTSTVWDGNLSEITHISNLGSIMYTNFAIWLIITSVILLLAMVGAIVITIKEKNYNKTMGL